MKWHNSWMMASALVASVLFQGQVALSAQNDSSIKSQKEKYFPLPAPTAFKAYTDDEYQAALKEAKGGTRNIAEVDRVDDLTALSDDLKNIRSALIGGPIYKNKQATAEKRDGVKSALDVVKLIADLEKQYDSLETDAQFVAAQIIALKPFQSAVYRARHLIDKAELTKSAVITSLRLAATGQNTFFPTEQWKAGFDFLTAPTEGMGEDIPHVENLHRVILSEVRPSVEKLHSRLSVMKFNRPIYFDNKMSFATANFVSDDDRYVALGETERITALSGLAFGISSMYMGLAYYWDGAFETADSVARIYGFRATVSSLIPGMDFVDGATAEKRTAIVQKNTKLMTLRDGGAKWTSAAYQWFLSGVQHAKIAWSMAKRDAHSSVNTNNLFDPRAIFPFIRQTDTSFATIESLIHGDGVSSAVVAGETLDVKFKEMFENPPQDLKDFLPTGFDRGQSVIASPYARDTNGKLRGGYRNYLKGSPTEWNLKAWQKYFPGVKTNEDIRRAARVMGQAWGGAIVGVPVGAMVF